MKLNRTVMRAIDILDALSKKKEGYTIAQLTELLDAPKTSVYDILKTLQHRNMIIEESIRGSRVYKMGLQSFLIGSSYLNEIDFSKVAIPYLEELAERMHATTFMAVMNDYQVAYIYKHESSKSIITTANVGTRRPVNEAALGKSIIAFASDQVIRDTIAHTEFKPITKRTITSVERFIDEIKMVREKGYAIDDRENNDIQVCAAAPIWNAKGEVVASISCVGCYDKLLNLDELGKEVKKVADEISRILGYRNEWR